MESGEKGAKKLKEIQDVGELPCLSQISRKFLQPRLKVERTELYTSHKRLIFNPASTL